MRLLLVGLVTDSVFEAIIMSLSAKSGGSLITNAADSGALVGMRGGKERAPRECLPLLSLFLCLFPYLSFFGIGSGRGGWGGYRGVVCLYGGENRVLIT